MNTAVNAGREDLNHLLRASHIPADEPIFYLRGRDPAAFEGVLAYAHRAAELGVPVAVIEQGLQQADRILAWPRKLLPGAEHLSSAERAQLEYQFSRRAWRARDDVALGQALMLAERRGWDAAMGRMRTEGQLV